MEFVDCIVHQFVLLFWYVNEKEWSVQSTSTIIKPRREPTEYGVGDLVVAKFSGKPYRAVIIRIKEKKEDLSEDVKLLSGLLKDHTLSPNQIVCKMGVVAELEHPEGTIQTDVRNPQSSSVKKPSSNPDPVVRTAIKSVDAPQMDTTSNPGKTSTEEHISIFGHSKPSSGVKKTSNEVDARPKTDATSKPGKTSISTVGHSTSSSGVKKTISAVDARPKTDATSKPGKTSISTVGHSSSSGVKKTISAVDARPKTDATSKPGKTSISTVGHSTSSSGVKKTISADKLRASALEQLSKDRQRSIDQMLEQAEKPEKPKHRLDEERFVNRKEFENMRSDVRYLKRKLHELMQRGSTKSASENVDHQEQQTKKAVKSLQYTEPVKTKEVESCPIIVSDCEELFNAFTLNELTQAISHLDDLYDCVKTILLMLFPKSYITSHSVTGQKPNLQTPAKPKFDSRLFGVFEKLMKSKFPALKKADLTAKIASVQKYCKK